MKSVLWTTPATVGKAVKFLHVSLVNLKSSDLRGSLLYHIYLPWLKPIDKEYNILSKSVIGPLYLWVTSPINF